jgi:uncharacterized membrane protein YjfL (UPF0719 family)
MEQRGNEWECSVLRQTTHYMVGYIEFDSIIYIFAKMKDYSSFEILRNQNL